MNKQDTIRKQAHHIRVTHQKILLVSILCFATILASTHLITSYQYNKVLTRHKQLVLQHKKLARQWGAQQKIHKKIKRLHTCLSLLSPSHCAQALHQISESIPMKTILHSFSYQNTHDITLTGYTDTLYNLAQFMNTLQNAQLIKQIPLTQGYQFTIRYSLRTQNSTKK